MEAPAAADPERDTEEEEDAEWDIPPLSDDEIRGALKFLINLYADWQHDDFHRLTPEEEAEVPGAIREMLPQNQAVTQAVRTLDLGGKYGILLKFVGRRALHEIRKRRDAQKAQQLAAEEQGPEVIHFDQG